MRSVAEAMALAGEDLWSECIKDDDLEAITELFVENDFGWHVQRDGTDGLYDKSPGLEYCGHTAAVAGRRIGDFVDDDACYDVALDPRLCRMVFPSNSRFATQAWWSKAGYQRESALADEIVRGAVCTLSTRSHIIMALESPSGGEFETLEGNTYGRFPDGTTGKGVVRKTRKVSEIGAIYLFGKEHTTNAQIFG